ncbi:MAG: hypothetical protein ACREMS_10345 [Gemmatimonadaceae bacterium]
MRRTIVPFVLLAFAVGGCASLRGVLSQSYAIMSPTQFDSLVNNVDWTGGNTRDRCTNEACDTTVKVRIDANKTSYKIDSTNSGTQGTIVARVRNMGSATTFMYHFKPGPNYTYYFLVKQSGVSSIWVLLEKRVGFAADSIASGPFTRCYHPPIASARADFRDCTPVVTSGIGGPQVTALVSEGLAGTTAHPSSAVAEKPAWIGCAYGCCPMPTVAGT